MANTSRSAPGQRSAERDRSAEGSDAGHVPSAGQASTERTPLLAGSSGAASIDPADRPLPKLQLFLLCFARLTEPVAFFSIFPYVNEFVHETGIPRSRCGWYTGLIESLFSLVQFVIMPIWGRYSDTRGRKPILVMSLFGMAFTSVLFGLSSSVYQMMLFRCLSGFFGGSTVTIRTMLSEISTSKTQARAFSLFAFGGNLAIFLAPLMGGALSKPAEQFSVFKHFQPFIDYPYLLPCLVTGSLAFIAGLLNLFFLKETLQQNEGKDGAGKEPAPTAREILASPGVKPVLVIYLYTFLIAFAYTALAPVFQFTPIELGGYSLTPAQISYLLACGGAGQAFWTLVVFPPLHKRIGSRGILRIASVLWCACFCLYAGMNLALRAGLSYATFWTTSFGVALLSSAISMSFTSVQLCINDISPSPSALGTLNGIGLSGMAATRAFAPALITSIFAFGVEHRVLKGQLAWLVLLLVALGNVVAVRHLPKKAYGYVSESSVSVRAVDGDAP